jgi:hypothetical protein
MYMEIMKDMELMENRNNWDLLWFWVSVGNCAAGCHVDLETCDWLEGERCYNEFITWSL